MTPEVSVVLPCGASHAGVLGECLASLREQPFSRPYEIVVVNSHDSQAVAEVASKFGARLVATTGIDNAGAARNIGVDAAKAKILAFIDADCTAEPGWLSTLCESISDGMIAVGGPVLNRFPADPVAVIDNLMQFVDQAPGRPASPARELPGCNMAIQRAAFESIGGFPEDIYPGEDTVFSQRVARQWPDQTRYVPRMRIRHRGRTAVKEFIRHQRDFGFSRGRYGLNITKRQQALGRVAPLSAMAGLRRAGYFIFRTAQWDLPSLPRLLLFSPLLLLGLAAWAQGFTRGCRLAAVDQHE